MTTSGSQAAVIVSLRDVMAHVGEFMFQWSMLEQQLTRSIEQARQTLNEEPVKVKGTLAERLEIWAALVPKLTSTEPDAPQFKQVYDQTLTLKTVRNLIVHGLCAGSAIPEEGDPHILCVVGGFNDPSGEMVRYSIADLEHFTQGADACRRGIQNFRHFNYLVRPADIRLPKT